MSVYLADSASRGIEYLRRQRRLDFDAILALNLMVNDQQDGRLSFARRAAARYLAAWKDPLNRLLDESYDDRADFRRGVLEYHSSESIFATTVACLNADRQGGVTMGLLERLEGQLDGGGYGSTHVLWGCALLRQSCGVQDKRVDRLMERAAQESAAAQCGSATGDLFFERAAFLMWLGYPRLVRPSWIMRILEAQNSDGGWPMAARGESKQHPSCLALAALLLGKESSESRLRTL